MSTLKRIYHLAALMALLNLLGLAGVAGYLAWTGKLTPENVRAMAQVLRPEAEEAEVAESETPSEPRTEAEKDQTPVPGSVEEETARRNLERVIMEANQRLILANRQMVEVKRRREDFERREVERAKLRNRQAEQRAKKGFQKDLEILSLLKPKVAVDSLLAREVDDAARMLMAMEARRSKKIIEAAQKDPRRRAAMLAIQLRLRELSVEDKSGAESQEGEG